MVELLLYAIYIIRPNIARALNKLLKFLYNTIA